MTLYMTIEPVSPLAARS